MTEELRIEDLLQTEAEPLELPVVAVKELPGAHLKKEREIRGLTVSEVAHALKFGVRQIEALEADDYHGLQGATFLRGFIRAYARYLKLDEVPLLKLLDSSAPPAQAEIVAPTNMGEATTQPFIERNQKWVMLLMALVVIGAVGAYWLTMNERSGDGDSSTVAAKSEETPAATEAATGITAPNPVALAPAAPVETLAVPPVAPGSGTATAQAAPVAAQPAPGEKQVILDFDGRSWIEVKDASQRVIFTGEYGSGTHQVVSGKPPFQLWVGKTSSVRVTYNEQKVNLQPYTRDEVARLTLD